MSQIRSNSLSSSFVQNLPPIHPTTQVFQSILTLPLTLPPDINLTQQHDPIDELHHRLLIKVGFFINFIMKSLKYKNQLKKITVKVSEFDKIKALNGLASSQKQIMKFAVVLKHHDIEFCRTYLAKIIEKMILGEKNMQENQRI